MTAELAISLGGILISVIVGVWVLAWMLARIRLEIADIRGETNTKFATIQGEISLLNLRLGNGEERLDQHSVRARVHSRKLAAVDVPPLPKLPTDR